jgi:hypothetical protein
MITHPACRSRLVRLFARWVLVAPFVAAGALPALAQSPDTTMQRPYRGVFAPSSTKSRTFDLLWSASGAYDDNVSTDMPGYDPRLAIGGGYGMASGTMNYSVKGRTTTFGATGHANARYYPNLADLNVIDGSGGFAVTTDVTRQLKLSVSQSLSYLSYYQFGFLNGVAPSQVPEPERITTAASSAMQTVGSVSADGRVQLVQTIGRRSSLSGDYGYRFSKLETSPDAFLWQLANVRFTKPFTRYASLRLGYGYGLTSSGLTVVPVVPVDPPVPVDPTQPARPVAGPETAAPIETQNIDVGVAYTKPLSQSRRTYLTVSPGTSVVNYAGKRQVVAIVNAGLTHHLGATWNANLLYDRGVQFVEGIAGPLYADTVQVRVGGTLTRSVEVSVSSLYSNGQIGLGGTDPGYDTYAAFGTFRFAFSRNLSLEAQYRYSQYMFDERAPLLAGLPHTSEQQGFRIGVTGWLPFLR